MGYDESAPVCETEFLDRRVPDDLRLAELIVWCRRLAEWSVGSARRTAGYDGSVSLRTAEGFIVSGAHVDFTSMKPAQFVEVIGCEQTPCCVRLRCRGTAIPAAVAPIHHALYRWRPDAQAVLCTFDPAILASAQRLQLPMVDKSSASESSALAVSLEPFVRAHDFVIIKDLGFLALGASIDAAGRLAELWHRKAIQ